MFLSVTEAKYVSDYTIHLCFSDGSSGDVDLYEYLTGAVFQPLKDIEFFKRFAIVGDTIEWESGADFAPEFLQEHCKNLTKPYPKAS